VGHEDDGLGAVLEGILDGGEGTDDALVVGDVLVGVERDVEVDLGGQSVSGEGIAAGLKL
jgi:hypothetical protein